MFMPHKMPWYLLLVLLVTAPFAPARSEDFSRLIFTNSLGEEIVSVRVEYATPYGKPRYTSSTIFLPPGGDYHIGVQGTTLPERIILDLATKSYDFPDLSGLKPETFMHLEVNHTDGVPVLARVDAEDLRIKGQEQDYLTCYNRPNAVDRNLLTSLKTWGEIERLVREHTEAVVERLGPAKTVDVEAGPIWNHPHALERCPEAIAEWSGLDSPARDSARWTGHWTTTIPDEMSVCGCVEGTADLAGTLFEEDAGWGRTLYFPLMWKDWQGVARVQAMDKSAPEEGVGFDLRFRLAEAGEGGVAKMLDELLGDLRVDGFRPWSFRIRTVANPDAPETAAAESADASPFGDSTDSAASDGSEVSGGTAESEGAADAATDAPGEAEMYFKSFPGDKYNAQDELQRRLFSAYAAGTLAEAVSTWVQEGAFSAAQKGEEAPLSPGVMLLFSRGTFEAVFIPDGRMLMLGGE